MRLIIVRHALTPNNERKRVQVADAPLSTRGEAQAKKLAERLKDEPITHIYTSPALRTRKTAEAIAAHHQAEPIEAEAIKEKEYGPFIGKSAQEYGAWVRERQKKEPWGTPRPEGGESTKDVQERIAGFVDELREKHLEDTVVIVSHGSLCTTLLMSLKRAPFKEEHYRRHFHGPAALSVVELGPNRFLVERQACTRHLGRTRQPRRGRQPRKGTKQRRNTARGTRRSGRSRQGSSSRRRGRTTGGRTSTRQ